MTTRPCTVTVGSLHYDIVIDAPHRPVAGETVAGHRWYPKFGGKGDNQAVAAAAAGCVSRMVAATGDDDFGTFLRRKLKESGVDDRWVAELTGEGSGMSVAISDVTGDYGAVFVSGSNLGIAVGQLADPSVWEGAGVLVLQNEIPESVNIAAAMEARARGLPVVLNAAPYRPMSDTFLDLVTILVVNAVEAEGMCGVAVSDPASAARAAQTLGKRFPCVVVTAGGDGVAVMEDGATRSIAARPVKLISTHGAGDCFTGTLAARLCFGDSLFEAAKAANQAAGEHVSRVRDTV